MPFPVLSIRQPWAHAAVVGAKDVENRTWATSYRGPLLVHAARAVDVRGLDVCRRMGVDLPDELPTGVIVGVVELLEVAEHSTSPWWEPGKLAWVLANARALTSHVPHRGLLGLHRAPRHVERRVRALL